MGSTVYPQFQDEVRKFQTIKFVVLRFRQHCTKYTKSTCQISFAPRERVPNSPADVVVLAFFPFIHGKLPLPQTISCQLLGPQNEEIQRFCGVIVAGAAILQEEPRRPHWVPLPVQSLVKMESTSGHPGF